MSRRNHREVLGPLVKSINHHTNININKWWYRHITNEGYTILRGSQAMAEGLSLAQASGFLMGIATVSNNKDCSNCVAKADLEKHRKMFRAIQSVIKVRG